jgi:beta-glucosidase/6-phospho-beta-glucosidase/beta-galactosidase
MNYFLYKQDIVRLAAIGVKYYSFSVSWTRILPFGTAGTPINEPGLAHYDDVINTCIQYGITPVVTLLHFDTPRSVNTSNVAEFRRDFLNYAKIVMTHYADRVPIWATINEPNLSFFYPGISPFISQSLAHADVYHWYKEELKGTGRITIKFANNL